MIFRIVCAFTSGMISGKKDVYRDIYTSIVKYHRLKGNRCSFSIIDMVKPTIGKCSGNIPRYKIGCCRFIENGGDDFRSYNMYYRPQI